MTGKHVGVVVPAYRETERLAVTLASLNALEHDGQVSIVVAVDGADPKTIAVAEAAGVTVVPVFPNGGSYGARNAGLDALPDGVDAVLFTDADCVVPPHWVTAHLAALEGADLSGGAVRFTFAGARPTPAEWVDSCRHLKQQVYVERDGFAATCNLAVRGDIARRHRFDSRLRTGGDAEFCRRVGGRLAYSPEAWIEHPARNLKELRTKVARLSSGVAGQAERWRGRQLPSSRLTRGIWRRAQLAGHDVGPVWGVSACLLDWALNQQVRRAVHRLPERDSCVTYVLTKYVQPTQTFVSGEIAEMRRQGVEVEIVSMERGEVDPDPGERVRVLASEQPTRQQLLLEHLVAARHPLRYLRFLAAVFQLRREMGPAPEQVRWTLLPGVARDLRGQALHAHFAWSGAAAAMLLARLTGRPWSVTLHANDIFNRQRNLALKLADADRLVTVCDYNLAWMRENLGLTRDVSLVVCGVVPPELPWPREGDADVVAIGRLVEKKGFDVLVRAIALLRASHPDVRLDIVGEGRTRAALAALIVELGVQDNVRLLGALPHERALARIAGARVFCLPARIADDGDRDSMPVVIKEAMARLVPVVASEIVAIPEMLGDGCGWMVPPDDPAALAKALDEALSDPQSAQAVAARARSRVEERFTLAGETGRLRSLLVP